MNVFTSLVPKSSQTGGGGGVSAHYVITERESKFSIPGGEVFALVPDAMGARHAGCSFWKGVRGLNDVSLGIEHVNGGFIDTDFSSMNPPCSLENLEESIEKEGNALGVQNLNNLSVRLKVLGGVQSYDLCREWVPFDPDQIHASGLLSQHLVQKYNIQPTDVVTHGDIAPGRKFDVGVLFPFEELYEKYGVGAWLTQNERSSEELEKLYAPKEPLPQGLSLEFLSTYLQKYGYDVGPTSNPEDPKLSNALQAFKAHFSSNMKPKGYFAPGDKNDMLWVWGLCSKYDKKLIKN
jgi:N-acetylmuramoyl-L-alanine amidase